MSNVVNKLWNMFNMNTQEDQDEDDYEDIEDYDDIEEEEDDEPRGIFGRKTTKTSQSSVKMVVMQPSSFENAPEICDLLRERKSIIINLEYVNKDVARRIIDTVSGAARVLDGHMQKISNSIFLIAPYNYDISTDTKDESTSKLPVSWLKNNNG